jgi:hypothetical protein
MKSDRLRLLVNELRRGEFIQGEGELRGPGRHCALGVACEVFRRHADEGRWIPMGRRSGFVLSDDPSPFRGWASTTPPDEVVRWYLHDIPDSHLVRALDRLFEQVMAQNDRGVPFEQLAGMIEAFIAGDQEGDTEEPVGAFC